MRIEYTNTLDDFREASIPPTEGTGATIQDRRRANGVTVIVLIALACSGLLWKTITGGWFTQRPTAPGAPADLTYAIFLPLVPTLVLLMGWTFPWASTGGASRSWPVVRRRLLPMFLLLIALVTFLVLFVAGSGTGIPWRPTRAGTLAWGLLPSLALIGITWLWINYDVPDAVKMSWDQQVQLHSPKVVVIDSDGFQQSDIDGSRSYLWSAFAACRETDNLYLLFLRWGTYYIVPKRALLPPDEVMLRALARSKVSTCQLMPRDGAFPVITASAH